MSGRLTRLTSLALLALGPTVERLAIDAERRRGAHLVALAGLQDLLGVEILQLFERQLLVVTLIRDVLDRGLRVAIGTETGVSYG